MERSKRQLDQDLPHPDNRTERCDLGSSRPDAGHPQPRRLRPLLDPGFTDVTAASELLKPYDARLMRCYPVSTRINHAANDDAECRSPVELVQVQARLF